MTFDSILTVVIQVVGFLALWFLLSKFLFKPFIAVLEERENRTDGLKAAAASLTAEAEKLRTEYESAIAKANEEGAAVKETILHEARQTREKLLADARTQAAERLAKVREEIQREIGKGRESALHEAAAIARQMAEKVLGRKVA
jgi:F-type H+-transporting ATPase subunit b